MTRSEILFKTIDYLMHLPQNYKHFPDITIEKDLVYDEKYPYAAKGDIYYNKKFQDKGKYPVILNIHGGGYVGGDKKHRKSLSSYYADKGWLVFNINYRLSPMYPFPSGNSDCIKALNFLKTLEQKYNLDLDKVVVTGDSAGAYFATYIVAAVHNEELRKKLELPEPEVKVAGLMAFCGLYDVISAIDVKIPFGFGWDVGKCFLGMDLKRDFSNIHEYPHIKEVSSINYVNGDWCPTFVSYAQKDIFCPGQGERFIEALEKNNI
ncbi:MAG: alpha/beta hydrolase, partial [Christensenellales bacterium]